MKSVILGLKIGTFMIVLAFSSTAQTNYFESHQMIADSLEDVYGIPSSVMLSIAYHESAAGKSRVAMLLNNHFGIKGSNDLMKTHGIKSAYKFFPSVTDSYIAFCEMQRKRSYFETHQCSEDSKAWVKAIATSGYAGNATQWSQHVFGVIQKFELD
jgi:flagellum-specific peptidoglycan hydrolase FlgJ